MKYKLALLLPVVFFAAGCTEGYRYPCQDPDNWGDKKCQKPYCSANGTCPEDLTHYEKPGAPQSVPDTQKPVNRGACKC